MSCVNPNNPEFKRLLAITGNPLLAEIEFNKRENLEKGFDTDLDKKLRDTLQSLYPEIQLSYTNTPILPGDEGVYNQEQALTKAVNFRLKVVDSLMKLAEPKETKRAKKYGEEAEPERLTIRLNTKEKPYLENNIRKVLQGKSVPKDQIDYIFKYMRDNNLSEIPSNKLALDIAAKYSFPVEVFDSESQDYRDSISVGGGKNYTVKAIRTPGIANIISKSGGYHDDQFNKRRGDMAIWFRTDNTEESTPDNKTRRIIELQSFLQKTRKSDTLFVKGEVISDILTKVIQKFKRVGFRSIPEGQLFKVQNTWFSVGPLNRATGRRVIINTRTKATSNPLDESTFYELLEKYNIADDKRAEEKENFLKLFQKDNSWITFGIKTIMQDSARENYQTVRFPTGKTTAKIQGHTSNEQQIKQSYKKIESLYEEMNYLKNSKVVQLQSEDGFVSEIRYPDGTVSEPRYSSVAAVENDLNDQIQDLDAKIDMLLANINTLEFMATKKKGVYNFYENTIFNILKKLYGPKNIKTVTDSLDNSWYELNINNSRDLPNIMLQTDKTRILGQANIKAMTVLIDAVNQRQDTLPHEYAHHYIAWYRNTPIVQEAIKKWGSEEALVQSIGEQAVLQKGEAWNWWKTFSKWIINKIKSLSSLQKEELTNILTDAFLTRQDLSTTSVKPGVSEMFESSPELAKTGTPQQYSQYLSTIFPTTKVDDILFSTAREGTDSKFLTDDKEYSGKYAGQTKRFIINMINPLDTNYGINTAIVNVLKEENPNNDGIIGKEGERISMGDLATEQRENPGMSINNIIKDLSRRKRDTNVWVVNDSSQKHELGTKQDIEAFKKFVEKTSAPAETVKINSTIFEQNPNITEEEIKVIYENYSDLVSKDKTDKQVSYDAFRLMLNAYQVIKYKDTYIFGNYNRNNGTFVARLNSSPSSKELLSEAVPNIAKQGIDVISFVSKETANKLARSGYTISKEGFRNNLKGEDVLKYAAASNPQVFEKVFDKPADEILPEEIQAFDESVTQAYIPTEIDSKYIQKAGKDVTKILETYLSQFGILSKDISEIKDKLNIDEFGFVDILNKIVYTKNKENLPELAGEFIAYMMQYNHLVQDIVKTLIKTEALPLPKGSYQITESGDIKYDYKNIDKTPYFKYIGKLIAESLQNKVKGEYKKSLIDKIEELIKTFFNYITKKDLERININIGIITDNIMQQNKKLITASIYKPGAEGKPIKQVSIEDALKKDKFGASIIYELAKKGFILTGSTALSEQGTILRPDENPLHDIDWVSPFSRSETIDKFLDSYPDAIKVRDIIGTGTVTDSYLIAPENYSIGNYVNYVSPDGKISIKQYDVLDNNGQIAGTYRVRKNEKKNKMEEVSTGVEGKVIDFFSYDDFKSKDINEPYAYESKQGTVINLSNWKDIFRAKLDWVRYKDVWDYNRFIPNAYKTSIDEELSVYLANELKNQLDINVPLKQPNMLDILSTAKVVTQEDIDNKKLEC
jgi:hypothetical protein